MIIELLQIKQANSENCGPPLANKFDLEVGQRSRSRSRHGTIGKVLSQRMHTKYQSSTCNGAKVMAKVKIFVTDRLTDGLTDRRMRFNVPALSQKRGAIKNSAYNYHLLPTGFSLFY